VVEARGFHTHERFTRLQGGEFFDSELQRIRTAGADGAPDETSTHGCPHDVAIM